MKSLNNEYFSDLNDFLSKCDRSIKEYIEEQKDE